MSVIRSQCKDEAEYLQALRNDFAAAAMQALIIASKSCRPPQAARFAREMADAMLEALGR